MNRSLQKEIGVALKVNPNIGDEDSVLEAIATRISFIKNVLQESGCKALVLGISGGVDSTTAGRLCQIAINQMKAEGYDVKFIAVRLPYKTQADEADAQRALDFINPDMITTVNIADCVDGLMSSIATSSFLPNVSEVDFVKGNVKARSRMVAQYAIANFANGLVVGTDHASEAVMGFFTKGGDGFADLAPLSGLTKGQVRLIAKQLGSPQSLSEKAPTADLEDLDPGKLDEVAYGCTYNDIENYLVGNEVSEEVATIIEGAYMKTAHKRALPIVPE